MEGLIKGIIDVALGHNDNNNNDDDDHGDRESREERSRSTWAEVVSGNDQYGDTSGASHDNYNRRRPTPNSGRRQEEEAKGSANDQWETVGDGRNSRRPHHKDEKEGSQNDEWETVGGGRHSRQSHKDKEDASRNDKWETGGGRHSRQPHKVPVDNWHGYKRPLQEQVYSDDVEYSAHLEPSEEELSILSQACNKLWELDSNRLVPGKDYQIDCGEGKKVYQDGDMAQGSLFYWVNEDIFRRPTISRFCSLLDNYNPNEGCKEVVTSDERQEQAAFIEEISRTAPIKYLHKYLTSKGVASENYQDFKKMMTDIWFSLYGRGGMSSSSSAFEHVFVGEIKQRGEHEVSGFHNWLQFYLEEAKGRVDYQGYIFPRRRGQIPDSETQLLTLQFSWNGILKSVSSTLVGVSPEFEIALYTLCFFMGEEDNHVRLGPYSLNIKCYSLGHDKIGSVFPVAQC